MLIHFLPLVSVALGNLPDASEVVATPPQTDVARRVAQVQLAELLATSDTLDAIVATPDGRRFAIAYATDGIARRATAHVDARGRVIALVSDTQRVNATDAQRANVDIDRANADTQRVNDDEATSGLNTHASRIANAQHSRSVANHGAIDSSTSLVRARGALNWLSRELASATAIVRLSVDDRAAITLTTSDGDAYQLPTDASIAVGNAAPASRWAAAWDR